MTDIHSRCIGVRGEQAGITSHSVTFILHILRPEESSTGVEQSPSSALVSPPVSPLVQAGAVLTSGLVGIG